MTRKLDANATCSFRHEMPLTTQTRLDFESTDEHFVLPSKKELYTNLHNAGTIKSCLCRNGIFLYTNIHYTRVLFFI